MGVGDVSNTVEEDRETAEDGKAVKDPDDIKVVLPVTLSVTCVDEARVLELCTDGDACIIVITLECCEDFSVRGV